MVPDAMNMLGVASLVLLACFCLTLTFIAWWDSRANDYTSLKQHLRLIGISQIVIIMASVAIFTDIMTSCRIAAEKASPSIGMHEYSSLPAYRATK